MPSQSPSPSQPPAYVGCFRDCSLTQDETTGFGWYDDKSACAEGEGRDYADTTSYGAYGFHGWVTAPSFGACRG